MNLKKVISDENISISQLAEMLGIHYTYAWRIINGKRDPSPKIALKIIKVLNNKVNLNDIYDRSSN